MTKARMLMEMTWADVGEALGDDPLLIIPVGAIEQHGMHLPLGTDSLMAEYVARRVGDHFDGIVAPAVHYTPHSRPANGGGGTTFPGSFGIPGALLERLIFELTRDAFRQGFRRIVWISGHLENVVPITDALADACDGHGGQKAMYALIYSGEDCQEVLPEFGDFMMEHAATSETSGIQFLRPDLVRSEHFDKGGVARTAMYDVFPQVPELIPPSGMMGAISGASPDAGERILELGVARIVAGIRRDLQ